MPAQAGIQGREGGWIPACAGMTEQRVVIDAQIIAAGVFSKEERRTRRFRMINIPNFVSFVVKILFLICCGSAALTSLRPDLFCATSTN
jgi:hypothetical protein